MKKGFQGTEPQKEARYKTIRDREILASQMVYGIDYCVSFYGHFEEDGKEYFLFEYCQGGDLAGVQNKQPEHRFTEETAKQFVFQIGHSIHEMHKRRIVHRDIKPDNIFMSQSEAPQCRTGDYGLARVVGENNDFVAEKNELLNQTIAGSGFYMSPEMK